MLAAMMLIPTAAWAGACINASRTVHAPADANNTEQGRWVYSDFGFLDDPVWAFLAPENFPNTVTHPDGDHGTLLINTGACGNDARTDTTGIQTSGC